VTPLFLTLDEVLALHELQVRLFGGARGTRDMGLLESAIGNAESTFDGRFLHETLFEIAAAYAYGICRNHPFVDGNKRTAAATALTFLDLNGVELTASEDDLYDLFVGVAKGHVSKAAVTVFFEGHGR
jgi:death-on-curing protein